MRPLALALALLTAAAVAQDIETTRQQRAAVLARYKVASGAERRALAVELARLGYAISAGEQTAPSTEPPEGQLLYVLDRFDARIADGRERVAQLRQLLEDEAAGHDRGLLSTELFNTLAEIERDQRAKQQVVEDRGIGPMLADSIRTHRSEIVRFLDELIARRARGLGQPTAVGGDSLSIGTGVEIQNKVRVPGTRIGVSGEMNAQAILSRLPDGTYRMANILQGKAKSSFGWEASATDLEMVKGFGASFELTAGAGFEGRVAFAYDPTRPQDLVALAGDLALLLDDDEAGKLLELVFSDALVESLGNSGGTIAQKRAGLYELLARKATSNFFEGVRQESRSDLVSPNLARLATMARRALGDVEPDLGALDARGVYRIVAEFEGESRRNRRTRQFNFRAEAGARLELDAPLFDLDLDGGAGVSFLGWEERILADGTRAEGTVKTYFVSGEGAAGVKTPLEVVTASGKAGASVLYNVTIKQFRALDGSLAQAEVVVRRVSSDSIEVAAGIEDPNGIGYERGAKDVAATLVVDRFVLERPSAADLGLLDSILANQHTNLLLGDPSGLAEDFALLYAAETYRHDRVVSDLAIGVDSNKVKATKIFEGKLKAIQSAGRQRVEHVSGEAPAGNGLHGESFMGDPSAAIGD